MSNLKQYFPKHSQKYSDKQLLFKLMAYLKPLLPILFLSIIASLGYAAVDGLTIYLLKPVINDGLVNRDQGFISFLPILIPVLFLIRGIFNFASNYSMAWVSRKIVLNVRRDLFAHYLRLPTKFYDQNKTGDLLSKIIYNADQLYKACTDLIIDVVKEFFTIVFMLGLLLYTSWKLTLVFLLIGPIIGILFGVVSKIFRKLSHKSQDAIGSVMHNIREALEGQQVVRIFGGSEYMAIKIDKALKNYNRREMRQALVKNISIPVIQIVGSIGFGFTLYLALSGIVDPSLTAGDYAVLFASMIHILKPIKQVTSVNMYLQRALAAAESIFSILEQPAETDKGTIEIASDKLQGNIKFDNINFSYNNCEDNNKLVLNNINLDIKAKQTIALVGASGSGKSSLLKLLPRFYDDYLGNIYIDNINIKDYKLKNLRQHISLVSQHITLFNETIANNITHGIEFDINNIEHKNKLITATEAAGAYGFIQDLKDGFDTMVGENGILLSGGQRQRIAIARAIFKDAPILILDEATSALDTETEREIQLALENLMSTRTTLVIAHRLSTIINADKIVVMEHGKILESGRHDELISHNGVYNKLYNMQFNNSEEIIQGEI